MGSGLDWAVDVPDECRVGAQMHHIVEKAEVGEAIGTQGANKVRAFEPAEAVEEIGAVKPVPGVNGFEVEMQMCHV